NATSGSAQDLKTRGAGAIEGEPTVTHLSDMDVFINVLSDKVPLKLKILMLKLQLKLFLIVTSMADVGTVLARLSIPASENPGSVPDHVRLSGDAVTFDDRGETIEVKSSSVAETKQKLIDNPADLLSLVEYVNSIEMT
ncbi:hypothetical protein FRC00_002686, partial [Tulasnella sp. 408]